MKKIVLILLCIIALTGSTFAQTTYNYTGSIQTYTVPAGVTSITIDARGAQGGGSNGGAGGLGAQMTGTFAVTPGQVLSVVVGQQGLLQVGGNAQNSSGGGGGSFVYDATGPVLFVAAGGGGGKCNYAFSSPLHPLADGQITTAGGASSDGNPGGVGGNGGNAGLFGGNPCAGGGTGWLSVGGGPFGGLNAPTWAGGPGFCGGGGGGCGGVGGYGGGGGGGNHYGGGGGGGGYSGGGGGTDPTHGGGGGSYSIGTAQANLPGFQVGDGQVIITPIISCLGDLVPPVITCPANIITTNTAGSCGATVTYVAPTATDNCSGFAVNRYYIRSNAVGGEPWGQPENMIAMDATFGAGNWTNEYFETATIATVFSTATKMVFLEGSDAHADELNAFLTANLPSIEAWVNNGGIVFINAAPNEGGNINFGFGGTTLIYPNLCGAVTGVVPAHPIFNGPFTPITTSYTGGSFSHAQVSGAGLTPLIQGCGWDVMSYKAWGSGTAIFGGMTTPNFHSPAVEAQNLRQNILDWMDGLLPSGGPISLNQVSGLPSGSTFPGGVTVNTFVATDGNGNVSTNSFTVTVNDTEAAIITCPSDVNASADSSVCSTMVTYSLPAAMDNCSPVAINRYYIRSNAVGGEPWGQPENIMAMDAAFGAGNWTSEYFETAVVGTVFSSATKFVFLEGSDAHADELNTFLTANHTAIEAWVNAGGMLFLNAAPNEGANINFGFSSTTLTYPAMCGAVTGIVPAHPIFIGPFTPITTSYTGSSFSHAGVSGVGLTTLIQGCGYDQLSYKAWGSGTVAFGGMTTPNFHSPYAEALNLRQNILSWLDGMVDTASVTITQTAGMPSGSTFPVGTTVNTFQANDGHGNLSTCSFNVVVTDDLAPVANVASLTGLTGCSVTVSAIPTATDNCAGTVNGTTTDPLTYSTVGGYVVTWTYDDGNGNTSTQTQAVTVIDCSGIEDLGGLTVSIYPNPSNGIFTLSLSEMPKGKTSIKLLDALGQVLFANNLTTQSTYYDFSYLSSGTYYIQVVNADKNFTKTIVITQKH